MIDRKSVIDALEYLISEDCTDNQFDYADEIEAAIALLKEQEPRVLTLDELRALYNTVHFVWVEDNGDDNCFDGYAEVDVYKEKVELFEFGNEVQWEPDNDNYGKTWRCWSSRPTDEQMEATPWTE